MIDLLHGDCLELMKDIPDNSIDMVLCDPPYGTTACKWDTVIDFELMWEELKRITKDNGAICLFGQGLFSASLKLSNTKMYRYNLVWRKSKASRFAQAKLRFLNEHEDIIIFSKGKCSANSIVKMNYYPQGLRDCHKKMQDNNKNKTRENRKQMPIYTQNKTGYPKSILEFKNESKYVHPTQKPVALLEYLIKTYTLENETVLDFTMGSGSTGVACKNLNRKFIGIEKDDKYFQIAKERIYESD
jgi:site-specific DNA-methyltransferase (adenine-specific)